MDVKAISSGLASQITPEDILSTYKVMCFREHRIENLARVMTLARDHNITPQQAFLNLLELEEFSDALNINLIREYGQLVPVLTKYGAVVFTHPWDYFVSDYIRRNGTWEPVEQAVISDILKPGDVAVDIGANIGCHTALMAMKVGGGGTVHAFEPVSYNLTALRRMVDSNSFSQVHIHPLALSDAPGVVDLHLHGSNAGGNSIVGDGFVGRVEHARAVRLDDYLLPTLTRLDFIKIDVEGHEGSALAGARETLKHFKPNIMSEVAPNNLRARGTDPVVLLDSLFDLGLNLSVIGHQQSFKNGHELVTYIEKGSSYMDVIARR